MIELTSLTQHIELPSAAIAQVHAALTGPTRHYHDINHVLEMWFWYQQEMRVMISPENDKIVASAIFFHDAVYNATASAGQNEQQSHDLWMAMGGHLPYADKVGRIILATTNHVAHRGESRLSDLVLDLDLRRLAVPNDEFVRHNEALHAEYHHLSDEEWRASSSAFQSMLYAQRKLFYTCVCRAQHLDEQARENIRSIHRLWGMDVPALFC